MSTPLPNPPTNTRPTAPAQADAPRGRSRSAAKGRHLSPVEGLVPDTAPPRLGQERPRGPVVQLPLPYEYEVSPGVPAVPPLPDGLRLAEGDRTSGDGLPEPRAWAARLARAIAEVAIGERPPAQLSRWVARDQVVRLALRGQSVQRHPAARAQRGVARLRSVRGVRACAVAPGIVEASAVIVGGERAHAIAFRLEAVEGRWLATVVQLG